MHFVAKLLGEDWIGLRG